MLEAVPEPNDPPPGESAAGRPGAIRAACDDCGAHVSVSVAHERVKGTCSVCGSGSLTPVDDDAPPLPEAP